MPTLVVKKVRAQKQPSRGKVAKFDPVDYYGGIFRAIVVVESGAMYLIQGPVSADTSVQIQRLSSRSPRSIDDVFAGWPTDGFRQMQILEHTSKVQIGTIQPGEKFGLGDLRKGESDFRRTPVKEIWVETTQE